MRIIGLMFCFLVCMLQAQPAFERQVLDTNVAIGYGLAIGDVDGDNKADILLADKKQFVWYRNGDWKRFTLIENLTQSDNVCLAARDIDGDGKVEIAVGAQWNPGETADTARSGSVHFLIRPADPTSTWKAQKLHHEPTVHRMKWVMVAPNDFRLIVAPLHGRGNKNGEGAGVKIIAYKPSPNGKTWTHEVVDQSMHLTHNIDVIPVGDREHIAVGGKEGLKIFGYAKKKWTLVDWAIKDFSIGEVRRGLNSKASDHGSLSFFATIEPMHGDKVTVHFEKDRRIVLDSTYVQGHALACADLLGTGRDQVIAGWREPNKNGTTGIKIFASGDDLINYKSYWLDEGGIACEDLVVADLDGDKKPDVIAAGRASKNLNVYWNKRK